MKIFESSNTQLFQDDTLQFLKKQKDESFDTIIADPPYFLSTGGFSNSGGKAVSVNKGEWDNPDNLDVRVFYRIFIYEAYRTLKPNGTIWIFGTMHNIYLIGDLLGENEFKLLNNVTWQKSNPAPNLSRRMFTHSTETIIWAKKPDGKQVFNYDLMRELNGGKQMKDVWTTPTINKSEKRFGKHPTQKPLSILIRIIQASTNKDSVILDPFIGSGTTAVAGELLGRQVIGVDNSLEYLEIAKNRIKDYKNEKVGNIK